MEAVIENLKRRAIEMGATDAKIIDVGTVVTAAWVGLKCKFGCTRYNTSYCCPPRTPSYQQMQDILDSYQKALLIHCESYKIPTKIVNTLEQEMFFSGFHKAFGLGAGPCSLCAKCSLDKCVRPSNARPAMEACGIDVYATARNNGFHIEVLTDYACDENCFGLLLLE